MSERDLQAMTSTGSASMTAETFGSPGSGELTPDRPERRCDVHKPQRTDLDSDASIAIIGAAGLLSLIIAASVSAEKFTVVGLPDTQNYSDKYPLIFQNQTEWIVRNEQNFDIRFVSH